MTERTPGIGTGLGAALLLHAALITAVLMARSAPQLPTPKVFRIHMIAAPEGTPTIGVVQAPPKVATPPAPLPKAVARPEQKTAAPTQTPKAAPPPPKQVSAAPTPEVAPPKLAPAPASAPTAASADGGKGADLMNDFTGTEDFGHPEYLAALANVIMARFGAQNGNLKVMVQFTLHRDGTIHDLKRVGTSGNYSFDNRALGAIEGAKFNPLPTDYPNDALLVFFTFSPPKPPNT